MCHSMNLASVTSSTSVCKIAIEQSLSELIGRQKLNVASVPKNQTDMEVITNTASSSTSVLFAEIGNVAVVPKIITSKRGNIKHFQFLD